jgi:hypothetical protein
MANGQVIWAGPYDLGHDYYRCQIYVAFMTVHAFQAWRTALLGDSAEAVLPETQPRWLHSWRLGPISSRFRTHSHFACCFQACSGHVFCVQVCTGRISKESCRMSVFRTGRLWVRATSTCLDVHQTARAFKHKSSAVCVLTRSKDAELSVQDAARALKWCHMVSMSVGIFQVQLIVRACL